MAEVGRYQKKSTKFFEKCPEYTKVLTERRNKVEIIPSDFEEEKANSDVVKPSKEAQEFKEPLPKRKFEDMNLNEEGSSKRNRIINLD